MLKRKGHLQVKSVPPAALTGEKLFLPISIVAVASDFFINIFALYGSPNKKGYSPLGSSPEKHEKMRGKCLAG
jgi:hypothetical protein